ncbi:hypothetical protein HGP16_21310 [Rhizobium sp. P40RR-XXII]|uniref:hypothetical protein n=1 Tax=Rhizobium sp. P40RR-XXII TaxID=2726739 RepID=UPI001456A1FC|nr:hypothetical protein [Rhizobium sp. P40RR-XXII]NLS19080.1 hypothetical protein [Rhizobium sp. P40RR-XXII]
MTSFWTATVICPVAAISLHVEAPQPTFVSDQPLDCVDVVEKVLIKTKGRLLSFRSTKDKCIVIFLLDKEGERPEKVIVKVDRNKILDDKIE